MSHLPPAKSWPHKPLFVQSNPDACEGNLTVKSYDVHDSCPIGIPFEFESELFVGKLLFRVRNLENSKDKKKDELYFQGRKRLNQYIIQGQFKKETKVGNVLFGGEYQKPFRLAPPAWAEKIMLSVFRRINPGLKMKLCGSNPYVLGRILGGVQVVRADPIGQEPDIGSINLEESNAQFGMNMPDETKDLFPMDSKSRKLYFGKRREPKNMMFSTKMVYTFESFDDLLDYKDYKMDIGVFKSDMTKIMDTIPLQIMAKDSESGKFLWSFFLWHEKLLE